MDRSKKIEIVLPERLNKFLEEAAKGNKQSKNDEILSKLETFFNIESSISAVVRMKRWLKMQKETLDMDVIKNSGSLKKALVVDDHVVAKTITADMLSDAGIEVVIAENGHEAIACFDTSIELILMDYNMPGMNGDEATKAIRQKEKKFGMKKSAYIVGLTADNSDVISRACLDAGMNAVLEKPIFPERLKKILEELNLQN